ncbi:hypothetical protein LLG07_05970, partial [bacterium]|nr:hypothetical protein [bacterium]
MKNQLSKITTSTVLVLVLILSLFMFGCGKQEIKNELIEFDKQYYSVTGGSEAAKEIAKLEEEVLQKFGDSIDYKTEGEEYVASLKKINGYLEDISEDFKNIKIPEKMDVFYQKKLEQFANSLQGNKNFISDYENWKKGTWTNEEYKKNEELRIIYNKKADDLNLECNQIRSEVYKEYGLDDLLLKY